LGVKDLRVRTIGSQDAGAFVRAHHYSGKSTPNSQLHFGVFVGSRLEGAMQFGPPLDRRKLLGLVSGTQWNGMMELNRMVFTDRLPRNSESRALGFALRFMRKQYRHVEWVVSFADGTQCGDGTIYRATGFVLTGINPNKTIWASPEGFTFADVTARTSKKAMQTFSKVGLTSNGLPMKVAQAVGVDYKGGAGMEQFRAAGFKPLEGFQLRYVYFLNFEARRRLTVPVLPFSEIDRAGARMYRGVRPSGVGSIPAETPEVHSEEGGSTPTPTLQSS
jgi:hypothetical protein